MKLAKTGGFEMTQEEAEAYMAELSDFELDEETLAKTVGGGFYSECESLRSDLPPRKIR